MRPVIVMTQTNEFKKDGINILHKPFIDVEPLSFDLNLLKVDYDWLIFSSKNAVRYFQSFLSQVKVKKFAAIAAKTAEYFKSIGLDVLYYPSAYSQEGFLKSFKNIMVSNILILFSDQELLLLINGLKKQGHHYISI